MEELYLKVKEYLKMDTEISFQEFSEYYNTVLTYLQSNFEKMTQEEKIKVKFILSIVCSNSASRAQRKGPEMKKYKKMQEKTKFWSDAVNYNLLKGGLAQREIDEAVKQLEDNGNQ